MTEIVSHSPDGECVREWIGENRPGTAVLKAKRRNAAAQQIEEVGARLRSMMPWIGKNKLVDKSRN